MCTVSTRDVHLKPPVFTHVLTVSAPSSPEYCFFFPRAYTVPCIYSQTLLSWTERIIIIIDRTANKTVRSWNVRRNGTIWMPANVGRLDLISLHNIIVELQDSMRRRRRLAKGSWSPENVFIFINFTFSWSCSIIYLNYYEFIGS